MLNMTINGFATKRLLGEGGMATVYYAENSIGKRAAIKFLKPEYMKNAGVRDRFRQEAKIMVALDHENIRQVYDLEESDQYMAIVMEYLEGQDFSDYLGQVEKLPESRALAWFEQILAAFDYAHAQGVTHRDVKPSNMFLTSNGKLKILDFGIAKIKGDDLHLTRTNSMVGSPVYMSPEQIQTPKEVDFRTDIYSLGVTLYTLLAGGKPYDDTTESEFQILTRIVKEPLPPIPGISDTVNQAIAKATAKDRNDRFQSCRAFADFLKHGAPAVAPTPPRPRVSDATLVEGATVPVIPMDTPVEKPVEKPAPKPEPVKKEEVKPTPVKQPTADKPKPQPTPGGPGPEQKKRNPLPLIFGGIAALAVIAGGIYFFTRPTPPPPAPDPAPITNTPPAPTPDTVALALDTAEVVKAAKFKLMLKVLPANAGSVTGANTYKAGEEITISATPKSGYTFKSWQEDGKTVSRTASAKVNLTSHDRTFTAVFEANEQNAPKHALYLNFMPFNGGTVTGGGNYPEGKAITVVATPKAGFRFKQWEENGRAISTTASTTVYLTSGDRTLKAVFESAGQTAQTQQSSSSGCSSLYFDVKAGTLNGVGPKASMDEVKRQFPCFTGENAEGSSFNNGGGVFFTNHNFYYYTKKDWIEFRTGFKGSMSVQILNKSQSAVRASLGSPEGEYKNMDFFRTSTGCIMVTYTDGAATKVTAMGISPKQAAVSFD